MAGHTGDATTARDALRDDDAAVRATALTALARMGALADGDLRLALTDGDGRVRRRAAELAAAHESVDLVPTLAGDDDPFVAEAAAFALGERPGSRDDPAAVATLSTVARSHADALVREAAVAALGAIGHPDGLAAILQATGDKPAVRRRAVLALAPFDGPEVDEALRRALTDRDWQVRQAAEDLLADQ
jgi:HEAT repeat protein